MKARLAPGCRLMPDDELGPFATLSDGSVMTVRDNATRISCDGGRTWSEPRLMYRGGGPGRPSGIDASSSPGYMLRLTSGRLALVWNRLLAAGRKSYVGRGGDGQLSANPAS